MDNSTQQAGAPQTTQEPQTTKEPQAQEPQAAQKQAPQDPGFEGYMRLAARAMNKELFDELDGELEKAKKKVEGFDSLINNRLQGFTNEISGMAG